MKLNTLNTDIKNTIKDYVKFKFKNKDELKKAVDLWCSWRYKDKEIALIYYGHISNWNTSLITDMSNLFLDKANFNDNINNWDVSSVTNMDCMFKGASSFNQPLNEWDVSSVTNMGGMFFEAYSFNQPLNSWNVSSVTDM